MKNLNYFLALLLVLLSVFGFGQTNTKAKLIKPNIAQQVPLLVAQQNTPVNTFAEDFNSISNAMNLCTMNSFRELSASRRNSIGSMNDFPELLRNYVVARSFIDMDNRLLDCASSIIDSLVSTQPQNTITENPEKTAVKEATDESYIRPVPIVNVQQDCTQNLIYLSLASGSLILVLIMMLYKFIRAHKIFKDLYERIYDKILDELAEKLLVGIGVKEDDKFKDKIKKLVELNQRRKKGEMKLDEYIHKVDVVLE